MRNGSRVGGSKELFSFEIWLDAVFFEDFFHVGDLAIQKHFFHDKIPELCLN